MTQSGFPKGHSTQTIFLKFRDDRQKALIKNQITMSVSIDYSEDFDTVWYETLINKLANLNFGNSSIKIIFSYEGNRRQYAQLVDKKILIFWGPKG